MLDVREQVRVPVRVTLGRLEVGPRVERGEPGCEDCLELRATRTNRERRLAGSGSGLGEPLVTPAARRVADDLAAHLRSTREDGPARWVFHVDTTTLEVTRHPLLPDPLCPTCGDRPDDDAEQARITLTPQPKVAADQLRTRRVLRELDELEQLYVDDQTGLVRDVTTGHQGGLTVAAAMMPLRVPGIVEPGIGRTRSYATSRLVALLEALERWGGVEPTDKRVAVDASYDEVRDHALDPMSLGRHDPVLQTGSDAFEEYSPDRRCTWVWGHSLTRGQPVLVPEYLAYYYAHFGAPRKPFLFEISNGCALGSSQEEAILHGILEAVERDAFLLAWYARLPLPEIDMSSARRPEVRLQAAAVAEASGYRVRCFDSTMEHGIPSVWVMAEAVDEDGPALVCAAGAHLDQEQAALAALSELGPILWDLQRRFPEQREEAAAMAADPFRVHSMHDHSVLYGDPDAAARLDFLGAGPTTGFRGRLVTGDPLDLRADLVEVLARLELAGLECVVVDQTTPEHRAGGFSCVKVLLPGALPMTFGHQHRRVEGLRRLREVPVALGLRSPEDQWEINPHPHPFP